MNSFSCITNAKGKETLHFLVMWMASYQRALRKTLGGFFPTILDNQNSFVSSSAAFIVLRMGRKGYIKHIVNHKI